MSIFTIKNKNRSIICIKYSQLKWVRSGKNEPYFDREIYIWLSYFYTSFMSLLIPDFIKFCAVLQCGIAVGYLST